MAIIYTDGAEIGNIDDDFWKNTSLQKYGKMPIPWSILFRDQDEITISIKRGNVHIEGDTSHFLFYNRLMENEFVIEFFVQCEYCRKFSYASQFCEHCGALLL